MLMLQLKEKIFSHHRTQIITILVVAVGLQGLAAEVMLWAFDAH